MTPNLALFILCSVCSVVLLTSCDQGEFQNKFRSTFQPGLPADRTLVDSKGREVEVRVISRDQDRIAFVRDADNRTFQYAIASLSEEDQKWAKSLPVTMPEPANDVVISEEKSLSFHEASIQEVEEQLKEALAYHAGLEYDTMKYRSQQKHIDRLKNRLERLRFRTH